MICSSLCMSCLTFGGYEFRKVPYVSKVLSAPTEAIFRGANKEMTHAMTIVTLRGLFRNNIIITPSDKDDSIVIIDSTYYNNKIMELLNEKNTYKFLYKP